MAKADMPRAVAAGIINGRSASTYREEHKVSRPARPRFLQGRNKLRPKIASLTAKIAPKGASPLPVGLASPLIFTYFDIQIVRPSNSSP